MTEQEINEEFRMIISHALLGSDEYEITKESFELVLSECTKFALKLTEGKVYTRSMNCNMALCIFALWKHKQWGWVKVEDFLLANNYQRCGDFTYLVHFGLLEKLIAKREDGSKRNGYYKITGRGILFAENKLTVPAKFLFQDGKLKGFEGENINIIQALSVKFDYNQLLGIIPSGAKTDKEAKQSKLTQPSFF